MDPMTWLLLVSVIISIYLMGMILSEVKRSGRGHQDLQWIQESIEPPMEIAHLEPEINIQTRESQTSEEIKLSLNSITHQSSDHAGKEEQVLEEPLKESSDEEEKEIEELIKIEVVEESSSEQRESKEKDVKETLEIAQELRKELIKLKTILEKSKS